MANQQSDRISTEVPLTELHNTRIEQGDSDAPSSGRVYQEHEGYNDQLDCNALLRLGKVPVLKRSYGFMAIVGFTCTILTSWEACLVSFGIGLVNGGPAGMIYMYLFAWLGAGCTFTSLSEMASMAPVSAGQYFWVAMLAPRSQQRFYSYVTGWLTVIAWQSYVAGAMYFAGTLTQALVALSIPSYEPQRWHGTLLTWAVLAFGCVINTSMRRLLPILEGPILFFHILGFLGTMVPLVVLSPHRSSTDVWAAFENGGGWPTQGLSVMVGLLYAQFVFTGVDGANHMSEEIRNAPIQAPRAILLSTVLNGAIGFGMLLAALYALGDIDDVMNSPAGQLDYPFLNILQSGIGSTDGAIAMGAIVTVMQVWAGVAGMAAGSRMLWAFARDQGVPGRTFWTRLSHRQHLPVNCIMLTIFISMLLSLINIGSDKAFNDIVGLLTSGYYCSYLIACSLLLYRRLTGAILTPERLGDPKDLVNQVGKRLVWGPWRVRGLGGTLVNTFAVIYLSIALFFSFWPSSIPTNGEDMNYNILLLGGTMVFAVAYYAIWGRHHYVGPIIEITKDGSKPYPSVE